MSSETKRKCGAVSALEPSYSTLSADGVQGLTRCSSSRLGYTFAVFFAMLGCEAHGLILPEFLDWVKWYVFLFSFAVSGSLTVMRVAGGRIDILQMLIAGWFLLFMLIGSLQGAEYLQAFNAWRYVAVTVLVGLTSIALCPHSNAEVRSFSCALIVLVVVITGTTLVTMSATFDPGVQNILGFLYRHDGHDRFGEMYLTITRNMGLMTLVLFVALKHKRSVIWGLLGVLTLGLTVLGGGRGEMIATIFVLVWLLPLGWMVSLCAIGFVIFFALPAFSEYAAQIPFVWRIMYMLDNADFGERNILFNQSIERISEAPGIVITGAGAYSFQARFGYDAGMHPHNLAMEALQTSGIGLFLLVLLLFSAAVASFVILRGGKRFHQQVIASISLLMVIAGLKSGQIWQSWMLWFVLLSTSGRTFRLMAGLLNKTRLIMFGERVSADPPMHTSRG